MLGLAASRLSARGMTYEFVTDPLLAAPRLSKLDKQKSMQPLDIAANDFLHTKVMWVFFLDEDGKDAGVGAARLEELGREDIADYWARVAERVHPGCGYAVSPRGISGDVIHLGELYFAEHKRGVNGHVRAAMFTLYLLSSLHWPQAKEFYGFISEFKLMGGALCKYCFTRQEPVPNIWEGTVEEPLWLVGLSVEDLGKMSKDYLKLPNTFDAFMGAFKPHDQKSKPPAHPPMYPVSIPAQIVQ